MPGDADTLKLKVPAGREFDDEPEESERRDIIAVKRLHVAADGSGLGDDDEVGRSSSSWGQKLTLRGDIAECESWPDVAALGLKNRNLGLSAFACGDR